MRMSRRAGVVAPMLALLFMQVPGAVADEDPVQHVKAVADEVSQWAIAGVTDVANVVPQCPSSDPQWTASCEDGETFVGCRPDPATHYRCRLYFEGEGGDVDGWGADGLVGAATGAAGQVPGRAGVTAARLAAAGVNVATVAISEADSWRGWTEGRAFGARDVAFAAKQPYQDTGTRFAGGVQSESSSFVRRNADDIESAVLNSVNNGVTADYRFTFSYDSGPVTVQATNRRAADDPCSPGTGARLFGTDCHGPILVSGQAEGTVDCNAYSSIALAQPCGGQVSRDWNWASQGQTLYPRQLQAARLVFGADGRASIHDALGILHCRAPAHENGYWLQTFYLNFQQSLFDDHTFGQQNANGVALFGDDAGSCVVSPNGSGHIVTYDVTFNGLPIRMSGRFVPEGPAEALANCLATHDTRIPSTAACEGVVHTGGG